MRAHWLLTLSLVAVPLALGCGGSDKKYMIPVDSPAHPFRAPEADDLGPSADNDDWSLDEDEGDETADEGSDEAGGDATTPMVSALHAQQTQFDACYQKSRGKAPTGAVKVELVVTVAPSGKAANVKVSGLPAVEACVSKVVRGMTFPKPKSGKAVEVKMPIQFVAEK